MEERNVCKYKMVSQLTYGAYGANICTPVSCTFAYEFLLHRSLNMQACFFSKLETKVDQMMRSCHRFYADSYSHTSKNMMISDLFQYFPQNVQYVEVAGCMIMNSDVVKDDEDERFNKMNNIECVNNSKLFLGTFFNMFCNVKRNFEIFTVFVITRREHTVVYFWDPLLPCQYIFFDPLEASLQFLHFSRLKESLFELECFSGIIMTMDKFESSNDFFQYVKCNFS